MGDFELKDSSGDKFSFPVMSAQEEKEFEFGSLGTPADHLFFNGRLLPHAFPTHPANTFQAMTYSRSTSRTSSVSSSRDYSLMSSRSSSTNSRTSSCSSARTSTSEASSERRILLNHQTKLSSQLKQDSKERYSANINRRSLMTPEYGSSRRWQFIAVPLPRLIRQVSSSEKKENIEWIRSYSSSSQQYAKDRIATGTPTTTSSKAWFGQRIFSCFVSACVECHAIGTSSREGFA